MRRVMCQFVPRPCGNLVVQRGDCDAWEVLADLRGIVAGQCAASVPKKKKANRSTGLTL